MNALAIEAQEIKTDRLALRRPVPADASAVARSLGDPQCRADAVACAPALSRAGRARLAFPPGEPQQRTFRAPAGLDIDGCLVGYVAIDDRGQGLQLGYWLAKPLWGQGLMLEALTAVIAAHFDAAPLEPLVSGVFVDNPASLRLQDTLGFAVVGRSDVFPMARNAMVAHVDTQLTLPDWSAAAKRAA